MAPELFSNDGCHSYVSDLWCYGCCVYELSYGCLPFRNDIPLHDIMNNIHHFNPFDDNITKRIDNPISNIAKDFIMWLLDKNPIYRCNW
jgi:serine/threonine protein kinase